MTNDATRNTPPLVFLRPRRVALEIVALFSLSLSVLMPGEGTLGCFALSAVSFLSASSAKAVFEPFKSLRNRTGSFPLLTMLFPQ